MCKLTYRSKTCCSNPQRETLSTGRRFPPLDSSLSSDSNPDPVKEYCEADILLTEYEVPSYEASGEFLTLAERIKLMRGETLELLEGLQMYRKAALALEKDIRRCLEERESQEAEIESLRFKIRDQKQAIEKADRVARELEASLMVARHKIEGLENATQELRSSRQAQAAEIESLKSKLQGMEGERKMDDSELEQFRIAIKAFRRATARYF